MTEQQIVDSIPELLRLKDKGWKMYYSCHCGGSLKQNWNNKNYKGWMLVIRPTKRTVQVFHKNHLRGSFWLYQLTNKMQQYAIDL